MPTPVDPDWYPCGHPRTPANSRPNPVKGRSGSEKWMRCRECYLEIQREYKENNHDKVYGIIRRYHERQRYRFMLRDEEFTRPDEDTVRRFLRATHRVGDCVIWLGRETFAYKGVNARPQVVAYLWKIGWPRKMDGTPIPLGAIRPSCGNRLCVKPTHLTVDPHYKPGRRRKQGRRSAESAAKEASVQQLCLRGLPDTDALAL